MTKTQTDTEPDRHQLTVTYDGTTFKLPCPEAEVGITLTSLYRQFKRENGRSFEVRDQAGRLIATASRMNRVPTERTERFEWTWARAERKPGG